MWTDDQRKAHKPRGVRYPSDVSDEEWAIVEPMIPLARTGGRKRETDTREVFNAIRYIDRTGLQFGFFDLDIETERFFGMSIERLRNQYLSSHGFHLARSQALKHVLSREDSYNCVIALPPSGLLGSLWKVVSKAQVVTTVVLRDTPENILGRITFYDVESRLMQRDLTDHEKRHYLREIKRDIAYFNRSFCRADLSVDISGSSLENASRWVWGALRDELREYRITMEAIVDAYNSDERAMGWYY